MSTHAASLWRDLLDRIEDRFTAMEDRQKVIAVDGGNVTVQSYLPDAPLRTITKLRGASVDVGDDVLVRQMGGTPVVIGAFSDGEADTDAAAWLAVEQLRDVTPISADWFSDLNTALSAAGPGGTVMLSKDTDYAAPDPLRFEMGTQIVGQDRYTSRILATGAAGAMTSDAGTEISDVQMRNLTLAGGGVSPIGLDMRYLTFSDFDRLRIEGFTQHTVWLGGQQDTDIGGWLNSLTRSRIIASPGSEAIYMSGRVGAAGPPTANHNYLAHLMLGGGYSAGDGVVTIEAGEDNTLFHVDGGYGNAADSIMFKLLGEFTRRNKITNCRTENIGQSVYCTGRYNRFTDNALVATDATHHPVELDTGALRNTFVENVTSGGLTPAIHDLASGLQTQILAPTGEITATGEIRTSWVMTAGGTSTASRPAASSVTIGAQLYDLDLDKPIWSDGTSWRDASGAIV